MFKFLGLQILLISIILIGCSGEGPNKSTTEKPASIPRLSQLTGVELGPKTPFASIDDELAFLYSSKEGITFKKGSTKTVIESGKSPTNSLWLHYDGKNLYAFWWRKFYNGKGKQLFVSSSKDKGTTFGSVKIISNDFGVLPPIRIASDPSGKVMVTYHDERKQGVLQVYVNYSSDGGTTWESHDFRLDHDAVLPDTVDKNKSKIVTTSAEPYVFMLEGHKAIVIWQQVVTLDSIPALSINSRSYDFNTAKWSDVKTIYHNDGESGVQYSAAQYKNNLLIMVSLSGKGIISSLSTDSGENWDYLGSNYKKGVLSEKAHPGFLRAIGAGEEMFVWSTMSNDGPKKRIDFSRVSLTKKSWIDKPTKWARGKENSVTNYGGLIPGMLSDGTIITAWTDYQNLMPAVYVNSSKDQGKTWGKPKALSTPGYHHLSLVKLITGDKKAWFISSLLELKGTRTVNSLAYQTATLSSDGKLSFADVPVDRVHLSKEKMKSRLEKRVKEFWKLRKDAKWEETWGYFDPVYRMKFGKSNWLNTQGKISFGDFKLSNVVVDDDVFGVATGIIQVGLNTQQVTEGILEAAPYKKQQVTTKWGWFYDDWYFMPDVFFTQIHDY